MDIHALMASRHSVRQYLDKPIPMEIREQLYDFVISLNKESGLNIQIIYDERNAFLRGWQDMANSKDARITSL